MVCVVQDSWKELERFQSLYQEAAKSDEFLLSRLHDPEFAAATKLLAASRQVRRVGCRSTACLPARWAVLRAERWW